MYKRVNPECYPKRSELIEEMYEQKKVMKNRACRRKGAKEFNFKKQSANQIISNNKISRKENKNDFEIKLISRRQIQNYAYEESDQEWAITKSKITTHWILNDIFKIYSLTNFILLFYFFKSI